MLEQLETFRENGRKRERVMCTCGKTYVRTFNVRNSYKGCQSCSQKQRVNTSARLYKGMTLKKWADVLQTSESTVRKRVEKHGLQALDVNFVPESLQKRFKPDLEHSPRFKELLELLNKFGNTACSTNDTQTIEMFKSLGCEIRKVNNYNGHTGNVIHDVVTIWK